MSDASWPPRLPHAIKFSINDRHPRGRRQLGPSMLRSTLDRLAKDCKLRHAGTETPRDAEIVRVLLVSAILGTDSPAKVRLAVALRCNSVLSLSAALSATVQKLVGEVQEAASRVARLPPKTFPRRSRRPRRPRTPGATGRENVYVVLDDWLHAELTARVDAEWDEADVPIEQSEAHADFHKRVVRARQTLGIRIARRLLDTAATDAEHTKIVRTYGEHVDRIREAVRRVALAEEAALIKALRLIDE